MALRLGRALGPSPQFWLDLQAEYDISRAEQSVDTGAIKPLVTRPPGAGKAMMRALEDDMAARPGLHRRLADH